MDDGLGNIISSGDAQRVQGIELSVTGAITSNWNVIANYTFLDSETTESFTGTPPAPNLAAIGKRVPNVPEHAASVWTTYMPIENLTLGMGATYADKVYLNNTNLAFVPSAFAVDAMASYRIGQWLLQINATNLFDELNYAGSQNGRAVPSPGRTVIFSVGTTF